MTPIIQKRVSGGQESAMEGKKPTSRSGGRAPLYKLGFVFHAASLPQQASFVDQLIMREWSTARSLHNEEVHPR